MIRWTCVAGWKIHQRAAKLFLMQTCLSAVRRGRPTRVGTPRRAEGLLGVDGDLVAERCNAWTADAALLMQKGKCPMVAAQRPAAVCLQSVRSRSRCTAVSRADSAPGFARSRSNSWATAILLVNFLTTDMGPTFLLTGYFRNEISNQTGWRRCN